MLIIKTAATLTVFAANVCVYVCIVLLYQLAQCREDRSIILMNYINIAKGTTDPRVEFCLPK